MHLNADPSTVGAMSRLLTHRADLPTASPLAIAHKEIETGILDCIREVRPPFSPEAVVAEFADLLKRYRVTKIAGDRYAGEWVREPFRVRGISYQPSEDPKGVLYLNLLPLINSGKVKLLGNKRLVTQLIQLERRTSRGGRDSIDHAPGGHDDVANAVAGALLAATAKKPKMRWGTIDLARARSLERRGAGAPAYSLRRPHRAGRSETKGSALMVVENM